MDPALLQQLLGAAPAQDQQAQVDQQLADLLARRRARQPMPYKTGFGAGLGGLADIISAVRSNSAESALRAKHTDLEGQVSGARQAYAQAMMGAQQPVQHPPEMLAAPGYDPAAAEQDQQRKVQQLGTIGALTGDPLMAKFGAQVTDPRLAMEREQLAQGQQKFPLEMAIEKLKLASQGPQEALEGQTPSTFELLTKRAQVPKYAVNPMTGGLYDVHTGESAGGAGGGGIGLSQEAVDQAAHAFATTGTLPRLPMGKAGALLTTQIVNRAAQLHPDANLAGNKASYGADTRSLANLTKQADAMNSFETTALKNLDQFLATAKTVVDPGSPLFNAPARKFMQSVMGDPKMAEFNAARQVAVQEISKVLGGGLGGSAVSDSARHEASSLIGPDASLAQIEAAANILKKDMANRKAAVMEQLKSVRERSGGGGPETVPAVAPAAKRKIYDPTTHTLKDAP